MASVFYILSSQGLPLIHRSYRGDIAQDVPAVFQRRVIDEEELRITPVFEEQGHTYTFIRANNTYLLLVSSINTCSLQQIAFLHRCVAVFESYFKRVTEETIQDNFVIVYELLDEMCDFGFPQFTEEKALREYIVQTTMLTRVLGSKTTYSTSELPAAVTGAGGVTPWRPPKNYKYSRNEVFVDVIESINLLVGQDGSVLSSEVTGRVRMQSRLSGMPNVKIGLNDKLLFDLTGRAGRAVELEDLKFHQCVRLNEFESQRNISFVPPDGEFDLLSYRLDKQIVPPVQLACKVIRHGTTRVEVMCRAKTNFKSRSIANFVDVLIPVPADASRPEAACSHGTAKYAPESNMLVWALRNVSGGLTFNCRVQFHLPSIRSSDASALTKVPIKVKFEIPYYVASGFQVRYVHISEKSNYNAVPWVRYVTQSGDYEVRTG